MPIRVLIIDDDPPARERLRQLLAQHRDIEVGDDASADAPPDAIFLDVATPPATVRELVHACDPRPAVIFTSASSDLATDAFEVTALDSLVKPVGDERLARALGRLRRALLRVPQNGGGGEGSAPGVRRIAVRSRSQVVFVETKDIDWIGAEGNYSRVHTRAAKSYLMRELMSSVARRLDPAVFVRVHRSAIVNLERVQKVVSDPDGGHSLVLGSGATVRIGASHREELERLLGASF